MAHAIVTGTLSAKLVTFGIRIGTAKDDAAKNISFTQIHDGCDGQVGQKRWCKKCDKEVGESDIVKGYEHKKGQFAIFSKDEIDALKADNEKRLDIKEVVSVDQLDLARIEKTYFISPDGPGAGDAFAVLRESLRGYIAIGTFAFSGREHIAAVRPVGQGMHLHTLAYDYQMRTQEDLESVPADVDQSSLKLGKALIEIMKTDTLDLSAYVDERHRNVTALIKDRVAGGTITPITTQEQKPQTAAGLLEQLQASLAAMDAKPAQKAKRARKVA